MKRISILLSLVALMSLTILPSIAQEPVTLRVMNYSGEQQAFYDEVEAAFFAETGIALEWETLAQDAYRETLPRMFDDGSAPDVFFWIGANRVFTVNELMAVNWVQPLDSASLPADWMSRWPENSFMEGINVIDGDIYSFPFNDTKIWGAGYMFLNNQVFADAGLDPATDAPTSWNELLEVCRTIRAAGPYCISSPLEGTHFQRLWYPIVGSIYTDQFFDYQAGRFNIDDPRSLEAFTFIQNLYAEDLVVPGVNDANEARASLAFGEAAIYFDGAWMPSVFANTYEFTDVTAAPLPFPDSETRGSLAQRNSENKFFLSSSSAHPAEATLFIEWMTRPDGFFAQGYLENAFGTLAYADNAAFITDPAMLQVVDIALNQVPTMRVWYPEPALKCEAVAASQAFINAENVRRNWEWEEMVLAITTGADFAPVAQAIAAEKNRVFQETLVAEGIDPSCFAFPEWDGISDFDMSLYAGS